MKIGCLQLAPKLGAVNANMARATALLASLPPEQIDMLVLPEMVFTGYNFPSLEAITPFLEPSKAGPSTAWAKETAMRLGCLVTVGYPEIEHEAGEGEPLQAPKRYNATVTVSPAGDVVAHYRKSFLYMTDETWASEGSGFYSGTIESALLRGKSDHDTVQDAVVDVKAALARAPDVRVAAGICMDINPYKFEAQWDAFEFATHCTDIGADVVLLSTAWLSQTLTSEDVDPNSGEGRQPDLNTLSYWFARFQPVIEQHEKDVIVVFANRAGVEDSAVYAGTSCVLKLGRGEFELLDVLGKGEERAFVVDTDLSAKWALRSKQRREGQPIDTVNEGT